MARWIKAFRDQALTALQLHLNARRHAARRTGGDLRRRLELDLSGEGLHLRLQPALIGKLVLRERSIDQSHRSEEREAVIRILAGAWCPARCFSLLICDHGKMSHDRLD